MLLCEKGEDEDKSSDFFAINDEFSFNSGLGEKMDNLFGSKSNPRVGSSLRVDWSKGASIVVSPVDESISSPNSEYFIS